VKVIIGLARKRRQIETLSLHATNKKRAAAFPVTLNDLHGYLLVANKEAAVPLEVTLHATVSL